MSLPNPISKVLEDFEKKPSTAESFANNYSLRQNADNSLIDLALNTDDKHILAYLWLAVEANYNILIFKPKETDESSLTEAISTFIPHYRTAINMQEDKRSFDRRINHLNIVSEKKLSVKNQIDTIQKALPDYIIAKNLSKNYLDLLFSLSIYGTSSIISINFNPNNVQIVKMLKSKHFKVKEQHIPALDICLVLEKAEDSYKISKMTEYKWLSKAEMVINQDNQIYKQYENMYVIQNGIFNLANIQSCKVMQNYSNLNLIDPEDAVKELEKRVNLLQELCDIYNAKKEVKSAEMYYEIR
jgi:hypothetical protein